MEYYRTDELYHHGIKGQKWGVRRFQNEDGTYTEAGLKRRNKVPRSTERAAKKDAKEYARAKMYYGEGAGNRRKLINATIKERSKDPVYKERLDYYISKQDMANHAAKARTERKARDTANTVKKTTKGVINAAVGNTASAGATAIAIYMGLHYTGLDKKAADYGQKVARDIMNRISRSNFDARVMRGTFR